MRAAAPVRILDAGGWTDTWFAESGSVCNLAVGPAIDVQVRWSRPQPAGRSGPGRIDLSVAAFGQRYQFTPGRGPGHHPLLEAALARWAPGDGALEIEIATAVPPGSGLGTSAAVVVALIGALWELRGEPVSPADVAAAAHDVETVDLGRQSGVQDHLAASYGGASLVTVGPYPRASVRPLVLDPATWEALERRLVTVYLGAPHDSSAMHDAVIDRLRASADRQRLLDPLRVAAADAAAALEAGDLHAYGQAMISNTAAQAALHPGLVSERARAIIEWAARHRALGWKVNGAGGDGGSISLVGADEEAPLAGLVGAFPDAEVLGVRPMRAGLSVGPLAATQQP